MKKNKKTLIAAIPLFLIVILVFAGFGVWKKYRDTLMQNQEEQMLLTTRILSENMAMSTEEYEESLSFLAKTAENRPQDEAVLSRICTWKTNRESFQRVSRMYRL